MTVDLPFCPVVGLADVVAELLPDHGSVVANLTAIAALVVLLKSISGDEVAHVVVSVEPVPFRPKSQPC